MRGKRNLRFRTEEVSRIAKIHFQTLHYWKRVRLIIPSISKPKGAGHNIYWSFDDIVNAKVIHELRNKGISLQAITKVGKYLRKFHGYLENPFSNAFLIVGIDGDIFQVDGVGGDEVFSVLKQPGQHVFHYILNLGEIIKSTQIQVNKEREIILV